MQLRKALTIGGTAAWLAVLGYGLTACGDAPSEGYVKSLNYSPASSVYDPGYFMQTGKFPIYVPGRTEYYPESWSIELCKLPIDQNAGNACGWRDVDETTYHSVTVGQHWPDKNAKPLNMPTGNSYKING